MHKHQNLVLVNLFAPLLICPVVNIVRATETPHSQAGVDSLLGNKGHSVDQKDGFLCWVTLPADQEKELRISHQDSICVLLSPELFCILLDEHGSNECLARACAQKDNRVGLPRLGKELHLYRRMAMKSTKFGPPHERSHLVRSSLLNLTFTSFFLHLHGLSGVSLSFDDAVLPEWCLISDTTGESLLECHHQETCISLIFCKHKVIFKAFLLMCNSVDNVLTPKCN